MARQQDWESDRKRQSQRAARERRRGLREKGEPENCKENEQPPGEECFDHTVIVQDATNRVGASGSHECDKQ